MSERYLIFNGRLVRESSYFLSKNNRAFRFGDGLFESFRVAKHTPVWFNEHYARLIYGMHVLSLEIPLDFEHQIKDSIVRLSNSNKELNARIRLSVFRDTDGLYTPVDNKVSYIIDSVTLNDFHYKIPDKGLTIGISPYQKDSNAVTSSFKAISVYPSVLSGIWAKKKGFDEALILNNHGDVCEFIGSNVFWVRNNSLFTTSLSSGAVDGVMRKKIFEAAHDIGFLVTELEQAQLTDLLNADELWSTNSVIGIRWVKKFQTKKYHNPKVLSVFVLWINTRLSSLMGS